MKSIHYWPIQHSYFNCTLYSSWAEVANIRDPCTLIWFFSSDICLLTIDLDWKCCVVVKNGADHSVQHLWGESCWSLRLRVQFTTLHLSSHCPAKSHPVQYPQTHECCYHYLWHQHKMSQACSSGLMTTKMMRVVVECNWTIWRLHRPSFCWHIDI